MTPQEEEKVRQEQVKLFQSAQTWKVAFWILFYIVLAKIVFWLGGCAGPQ